MENIKRLREYLRSNGYSAIIIPTNDPHFSEYPAQYFKCREFISEFTGSAGNVIITLDRAVLWVDSRYWIQAEKEVDTSIFEIQKSGLDNSISISQWINNNLISGSLIAVDGKLFSCGAYDELCTSITDKKLVIVNDPFENIWENRPSLPKSMLYTMSVDITGESAPSKINRVRKDLSLGESDMYVTAILDEIAWLFNIRAKDIQYNPVAISYAAIGNNTAFIFIDKYKLTECQQRYFDEIAVQVIEYSDFGKFIAEMNGNRLIYDYNKFDIYHHNIAKDSGVELIKSSHLNGVITSLKSVKNSVEIEGFSKAMIDDGVALVRFMFWFDNAMKLSIPINEYELGQKLREFRKESPNYVDDSFAPIVAYGANSASAHYNASKDNSSPIIADGFILLDTGGQYIYGTTDITRTIHLSEPTLQQKIDYTAVLQGMIELSAAIFPVNYRGDQIDILARSYLFKESLNYGHGTGHGVGHFLSVHEGPQSIRPNYNPEVIKKAMVTSNEPAIYRKGEYGIRTENMMCVIEHSNNDFGEFLAFKTLTLCPIDLKPILVERLTPSQRRWLNQYHATVYDTLSPFLSGELNNYLSSKTKPI